MNRYDAVLFDAGETLVRPEPSFGGVLHAILDEIGHRFELDEVERKAREALAAASAQAVADGRTWSTSTEASKHFWTSIYRAMLESLRVDDDEGRIAGEIYTQFTQPHRYGLFPDALPALRELKATGYRLGVISNWEDWLESLLVRLQIMPLFDVVVISGAEGIEKPDPRIFRIALERLGVTAERTCYVGDNPSHDIEPAIALGMGAVLIDRHNRHPGAHRPTIESLGLISAVV